MDANPIPLATTGETQVLYHKMKGDYCRCIAESSKENAEKDIAVTHPIQTGLALNYAVCRHEELQNPEEANERVHTVFEDSGGEGEKGRRGGPDGTVLVSGPSGSPRVAAGGAAAPATLPGYRSQPTVASWSRVGTHRHPGAGSLGRRS